MRSGLFFASALALARICAAEIVESFKRIHSTDFDFVIIGGGTAGLVVANRLTENPHTTVLVLEAGGSPDGVLNISIPFYATRATHATRFDWNYTTVPQKGVNNRSLAYARGHVLGGSSSVNLLAYTKGSFEDWDRYARVTGDPGWSWNAMQKYFRRNEKWVPPADHHNIQGEFDPKVHSFNGNTGVSVAGFPWPLDQRVIRAARESKDKEFFFNLDHNSGRHLGVGYTQATIQDGERSSAATSYLGPQIAKRKNLHVVLNAQVAKVSGAKKSKGQPVFDTIEFTDGVGGPTKHVRATKEIILSGGSIGSPHILLNSGIGDRDDLSKVGVKSVLHLPSVGKNFSDHPGVYNQWTANAADSDTFDLLNRNDTLGNQSLAEWQKHHTGPLVDATFNTVAWVRLPPDADVFKKFPGFDPSPGPNTAHIELVPTNGILRPPFPPTGHYFLMGVCNLQPISVGSVTLNSSNPFDAPLIDPNFFGSEFDVAMLREGVKLARKFLTFPAFKDYILAPSTNATTDDEIDEFVKENLIGFQHPLGSCAMSPKGAEFGVVDPDLRLKKAEGLRIVDLSVLPFNPAAHTQAFVYALAERASDLIKSHWKI